MLDVAAHFDGLIGCIGHDNTEQAGYPGFSVWKCELLERGISEDRIRPVMGCFDDNNGVPTGNSLTESVALIRFLKKNSLQSVAIVAPHWHILRCTMHAVGRALCEYPTLRIYPCLGAQLPWAEQSAHSQGILEGIRADFMFSEAVRLFAYHEQRSFPLTRDIPDAEDVLAYLDWRDSIDGGFA